MTAFLLDHVVRKPGPAIAMFALAGMAGLIIFGTAAPPLRPEAAPAPTASAAAKRNVADLATAAPQSLANLTPEQAFVINEAEPLSTQPNPPAAPFMLPLISELNQRRAETCLAMAVYYEAASQGEEGEAAVAQVVLNRLRHPMFPKTVCGVVFEGSSLPTGCQFTFTCDGSLSRPPSADGWRKALEVAQRALAGHVDADVGEATHYHTLWVVPYWQPSVVKVAQVGAHIFYRWSGDLGRLGALRGAYAGSEPPLPLASGLGALAPKPIAPVALGENIETVAVVAAAEPPASPPVAAAAPPPAMLAPAIQPTGLDASPHLFGDEQAHSAHRLPVPGA